MTPNKQQSLLAGRTGLARRLFDAVPIAEGWTAAAIGAEARKKASMTTSIRVLEGALRDLVDAGLVKQSLNLYRRTAVSEPTPPPAPEPQEYPIGPEMVGVPLKAQYVEKFKELVIPEAPRHPPAPAPVPVIPVTPVPEKEVQVMVTPTTPAPKQAAIGQTHKQLSDLAARMRKIIAQQQFVLSELADELETISAVIDDEYASVEEKFKKFQVLKQALAGFSAE